MRTILAIALFFVLSCNNADKNAALQITGAYKMLWQSMKNDKVDTTYRNIEQLKFFTGDFMMYANFNPADSSGGFGVGSYTIVADTVIEHVTYDAGDTSKNENPRDYKLTIEKTAKGYKQTIPDIGDGHYKLTEEYETTGTDTKTPVDGLWKLTKSYSVKGNDTTNHHMTQYKAYHAGHFIFGYTNTDSLNKIHSGMGYGKVVVKSNNTLTESVMKSTYSSIVGKDFDLDIEMKGNDEFTQIITEEGEKLVEIYQRVKK